MAANTKQNSTIFFVISDSTLKEYELITLKYNRISCRLDLLSFLSTWKYNSLGDPTKQHKVWRKIVLNICNLPIWYFMGPLTSWFVISVFFFTALRSHHYLWKEGGLKLLSPKSHADCIHKPSVLFFSFASTGCNLCSITKFEKSLYGSVNA